MGTKCLYIQSHILGQINQQWVIYRVAVYLDDAFRCNFHTLASSLPLECGDKYAVNDS